MAGYVRNLAENQIAQNANIDLHIDTFGRWAMSALGYPDVRSDRARARLKSLAKALGELTPGYIIKEAEYLLGRFEPENLESYIASERTGRGATPRVDRRLRRRILDEVIYPYLAWLRDEGIEDWNSIAVRMGREIDPIGYDVVIVDESQDFSANQLRAIRHHLAPDHAITFVIDTVQRIYARGFTWAEAGFDVRAERVHTLRANHRNTVEIAAFAASILSGFGVEPDGVLPNLAAATSTGPRPKVLRGLYSRQIEWAIAHIANNIDLKTDSVAFLKPQAGAWFSTVKGQLDANGIQWVDITREQDWPDGDENVALSTFHSAKGLEFDYVFILGFNDENTPYPDEQLDDEVFVLRRLLAVAVARARKEVIVGYKPGAHSRLIQYFGAGTFDQINV
ncbi:3'-5' exonuclease [Sphingobium sp. R-7]|uniref:3'-5' exonuclease n=1 Tax=Sphingobium sp. R-7 TaxID=3375449 RepID=UPI00398B88B8